MQYGAMTLTALVGATLAIQVGMDATMRGHAGSPMAAALVNFAIGTVFLLVAVRSDAIRSRPSPARRGALVGLGRRHPRGTLHRGIGGLRSAVGGATFLALIVAGQMVTALALDHYGLLGFPVRPLDAWRIAGALLVVCGMFLLARLIKGDVTFFQFHRIHANH